MLNRRVAMATLGVAAAGAALLLAQPDMLPTRLRREPGADATTQHAARHAHVALQMLRQRTPQPANPVLALCADCAASRAVVRVLIRYTTRVSTLAPLAVIVDRRWPEVNTLLQASPGSSLTVIPTLSRLLPATPALLAPATGPHSASLADTLVIGVTQVISLLSNPRSLRDR